jgi:hypothetical protein
LVGVVYLPMIALTILFRSWGGLVLLHTANASASST